MTTPYLTISKSAITCISQVKHCSACSTDICTCGPHAQCQEHDKANSISQVDELSR